MRRPVQSADVNDFSISGCTVLSWQRSALTAPAVVQLFTQTHTHTCWLYAAADCTYCMITTCDPSPMDPVGWYYRGPCLPPPHTHMMVRHSHPQARLSGSLISRYIFRISKLTLSPPIPLRLHTLPYWSNPLFCTPPR